MASGSGGGVLRRVGLIALSAALCAGWVSPVDAADGPNGRVERWAFADVMLPTDTKNVFDWYAIDADHYAGSLGERTTATVVRGTCKRKERDYGYSISCSGTGFRKVIPSADFAFDPAMSSASVAVTMGRRTHRAEWTASEGPLPDGTYSAQEGCPEGEGAGGGLVKDARASGEVYGHEFRTGKNSWSMLWQGVMASQCEPWRVTEGPGDSVTATRVLEVRDPRRE